MLSKILATIESFIDWSGRTVSWLSLFLVVVTFIVVVLRYVFDSGSIALQETTTYFHATIFLIGMAYTMQQNAHVRVDIFYTRLSKQSKAWVDLFGALFLLLPFLLFLSWVSWQYVSDSWSVLEGSRQAGGLPGVFLLKSLILVMAGLLSLQAFTQIMRNIETILSNDTSRDLNKNLNDHSDNQQGGR